MKQFLMAALTLLFATALSAQLRPEDIARAEVLPGWTLPDGRQIAGLRLTLAPGWKTYWRVPGEAGLPLRLQLDGGVERHVELLWPEPELFDQAGYLGIGYADQLTLPIRIEGGGERLRGRVDIGVCREICVPMAFDLDAPLGTGSAPDPRLLGAMASQPLSRRDAGISAPACVVRPVADGFDLQLDLDLGTRPRPSHVIVESGRPGLSASLRPEFAFTGNQMRVSAHLKAESGAGGAFDRSKLRVTLFGGGRAVELRGCG